MVIIMEQEILKRFIGKYVFLKKADSFSFYLYVTELTTDTLLAEDSRGRLFCFKTDEIVSCRELGDKELERFRGKK